MPNVLLAWEFGGGLGHLFSLKSVADRLAVRGHRPVLAVKDLMDTKEALRDIPHPFLQSPRASTKTPPGFSATSFADILAIRGWRDVEELSVLVAAWQALLDVVQAKLIVCEHAPTLKLAAYSQLPVVTVGTGFTIPPCDGPNLPPLVASGQPQAPESELLSVAAEVQRRRGKPVPPTLPAILAGSASFIQTISELDPYRAVRQQPVIGPRECLPPVSMAEAELDYFVYLWANYPGVADIFPGLASRGWKGSAFIRAASPELRAKIQGYGVHVYESPPKLADVVPRAKLVIHHGGLATSTIVLMIGRPQLLLPRHLEQELTAKSLNELGVAEYLTGRISLEQVMQAVTAVHENGYAAAAERCAAELSRRYEAHDAEHIAECCCEYLE